MIDSYIIVIVGTVMTKTLKSMTSDELFKLHEEICAILSTKLVAKKGVLERQLWQLERSADRQSAGSKSRRSYPPVSPKFRNPDRPYETWAGRGKRPRWLRAQLRSGKRIDDFRIGPAT